MNNLETITIEEYLTKKGINFWESYGEIITHCLFSTCDEGKPERKGHLYFNAETSQYHCKKCDASGNIVTLAKHLGDEIRDIVVNQPVAVPKQRRNFDAQHVEVCHTALPDHIREYLNERGIPDQTIDEYKLGYKKLRGKNWITIPIKDAYGTYSYFKLRQDPTEGKDKITYPSGATAQIYDWEALKKENDSITVCEGELDRLLLTSKKVNAITSTHGAGTFKKEWIPHLMKFGAVYLCFDNDKAGRDGSERIALLLHEAGHENIKIIRLPEEISSGGDVTDYFVVLNGTLDDLYNKYSHEYPEKIDTSQFHEMGSAELTEILGLTIKKDEENKIATFLCELSAYTDNSQFNISFNAPSSTGKSYIPTEIARLFPEDDVKEIGYCSPTAFFHDEGEADPENKGRIIVDLSRKILIFLDQPHTQLLERLRPLLSHDKKEISVKITDKNQRQGMRTKNVILRGFPSVIFCTAGLLIDEQEATRFLLLSPEINQEKLRAGITQTIRKESDSDEFRAWLEEVPERKLLKERIRAIKLEQIKEVKISEQEKIKERFLNKMLKPRHQRDVRRLMSLVKSLALLNVWWRERDGSTITANDRDVEEAFKIWEKISVSQELNLPPYIFNLYREVIVAIWEEKNGDDDPVFGESKEGIERQEILRKHYAIYGRMLDSYQLRQQILPMLETTGLIYQEKDSKDSRKILVYPTMLLKDIGNSTCDGGGEREVKK